ncbi:hypothetical protein ACFV0T_02410 [Streptomyces sp. NPDC059582]|uniref:hypothetical protein n=1 Tax=Streptomyces sp. NPDC059582 TaxID=3346875 RepID=UPI0036956433
MSESVPVRCPACRREHRYAAPSYPCACGAPVAPRLDPRGAPTAPAHHVWEEQWVTLGCVSCGRRTQWPAPELGCPCGTLLRIPVAGGPEHPAAGAPMPPLTGAPVPPPAGTPVHPLTGAPVPPWESAPVPPPAGTPVRPAAGGPELPAPSGPMPPSTSGPMPPTTSEPVPPSANGPTPPSADAPVPRTADASTPPKTGAPLPRAARPAFRPVPIRTAVDAVTAAARYLRGLGYPDVRRADQRQPSGIGLAARGILAQVDPTVRPASVRDVECLWLTAMTDSSTCAYFSLAGYTRDARTRADTLGVPLFVLDLMGTPRPVNGSADRLHASGAS